MPRHRESSLPRKSCQKVKLIKTATIVDELIDSVFQKINKRYPNEEIKIILPEEPIAVDIDPLLIEQVIINLIENAILHAIGHTEIKLTVSSENDTIKFEVEDNGCGISEEKTNNFLNGKYTEDISDRKKKNAGIGLSVCTSIIKAHGGKIFAKKLDKGARFTFILYKEG